MSIAGKTYRIRSRSRFTLFIVVVIVLLVMIANTFLGLNEVSSLTQPAFIELEVQPGDTLWDIAHQYMAGNQDIRKSVYILCEMNRITPEELRPGQILTIPMN